MNDVNYDMDKGEELIYVVPRDNIYAEPKRMLRKDFIKDQEGRKPEEITHVAKCVYLILVNPFSGDIYLQRRANKKYNPYLFDKTVGGHVSSLDSPERTLQKEVFEEIRVPLWLCSSEFNARQSVVFDRDYCTMTVSAWYEDTFVNISKRLRRDGSYDHVGYLADLYMGFYDGPIQAGKDNEALGVLKFEYNELKKMLKRDPSDFTHDLHFLLDRCAPKLEEIFAFTKEFIRD